MLFASITAPAPGSGVTTVVRGHGRELNNAGAGRRFPATRPEAGVDRIGALLFAGRGRCGGAPSSPLKVTRSCPVVPRCGERLTARLEEAGWRP